MDAAVGQAMDTETKLWEEYYLWLLFGACNIVGITIIETQHIRTSRDDKDEWLLNTKATQEGIRQV